jgi:hypothetical protein
MYDFAYGSNMDLRRLSGRINRQPEGIPAGQYYLPDDYFKNIFSQKTID